MLLKFYTPFNTIGDLELLKNQPIACHIEATQNTYLISISSNIIRSSYLDNPKFLRHLVKHLTDKDYIVLNSSFLEIAQFLGTTYRHLNRTLKELEEKSIIKCKNKTIYILDEDKLRELSKNSYIKSL